jgi:hypothetical protein
MLLTPPPPPAPRTLPELDWRRKLQLRPRLLRPPATAFVETAHVCTLSTVVVGVLRPQADAAAMVVC